MILTFKPKRHEPLIESQLSLAIFNTAILVVILHVIPWAYRYSATVAGVAMRR